MCVCVCVCVCVFVCVCVLCVCFVCVLEREWEHYAYVEQARRCSFQWAFCFMSAAVFCSRFEWAVVVVCMFYVLTLVFI